MRDRTYLALVHHPTVDREGVEITTAITSLDLHDFSRLARTYGLGGVFAVTNLESQVELVGRLISHWVDGKGAKLNPLRREAFRILELVHSIEASVTKIQERWGQRPLIYATSARPGEDLLGYDEGRRILTETDRPALILFGTGWGLAPKAVELADRMLEPIDFGGGYNHLSVRSAASIIVDRLFGSDA